MFADTALLDAGKKTVRDFICQTHGDSVLLSEAETGLKQILSAQHIASTDLDKLLAD